MLINDFFVLREENRLNATVSGLWGLQPLQNLTIWGGESILEPLVALLQDGTSYLTSSGYLSC